MKKIISILVISITVVVTGYGQQSIETKDGFTWVKKLSGKDNHRLEITRVGNENIKGRTDSYLIVYYGPEPTSIHDSSILAGGDTLIVHFHPMGTVPEYNSWKIYKDADVFGEKYWQKVWAYGHKQTKKEMDSLAYYNKLTQKRYSEIKYLNHE